MIGAIQVRSSVLVQLNSERMKTRHARDAALSEMSHLINSVKAPVLAMDGMGLLVQWNAMLVQLTGCAQMMMFITSAHTDISICLSIYLSIYLAS